MTYKAEFAATSIQTRKTLLKWPVICNLHVFPPPSGSSAALNYKING